MLFDLDFLFVPVIFAKKSRNQPQNMRFAYSSIFEALALSALWNYDPASNKNAVFGSVITVNKFYLNLRSDISPALLSHPGEVMVVLREDYRSLMELGKGRIFVEKSMKIESLESFSAANVISYLIQQAENHPDKFSLLDHESKVLTLSDVSKSIRKLDFEGDEINNIPADQIAKTFSLN